MAKTQKILMEPYQPRKGYVLRRWCVKGKVFEHGKTYNVDPQTAAYLLSIHSRPKERGSPMAFRDVTKEIKKLDKTKRIAPPASLEVKEDRKAGTLTTEDLPENQPDDDDDWDSPDEVDEPEPSPAFPDEPEVEPDKPAKKKPRSRSSRRTG